MEDPFPAVAGGDGLAQDVQVLQRIHAFIGRHRSLLVFREQPLPLPRAVAERL
ncbi:hypothetical protein [Accumulibacter sp.]|uniref:hypothetical protein n=1 Tax=Accumulibacter sp. TaxID=2053492 RepID=UPI002C6A7633|nr:hypothetical protein [Accumulibacter sp.]HRF03408.1 hypothetical protein [Accumulibacter sp.]